MTQSDQLAYIGDQIKSMRKTLNLRQNTLAAYIGVTSHRMHMIEAGKHWPTVPELLQIMEALSIVFRMPCAQIVTEQIGKTRTVTKIIPPKS